MSPPARRGCGSRAAISGVRVGGKTGISVGVGLTSVILAFAMFRIFATLGWAQDYTILENNCTQSIATAAGYVVSPLFSSLPDRACARAGKPSNGGC